MKKKTLEQVDAEIIAVKGKIQNWQQELTKKKKYIDDLEVKRTELRHRALNDGDTKAKTALADIRPAIIAAGMEADELEAEAKDAAAEIDRLLDARKEAYRDKCRADLVAASKLALDQAEKIEQLLDQLMEAVRPHKEVLDTMNKLASECGVQAQFRLRHLERHVEAKFSGHSLHRIYKESYPIILRGGIDAAFKQLGGSTSNDEESTVEQGAAEAEQVTVN